MKRSLWLSMTAMVVGIGLLVASGFAGAATTKVAAKKGGTLKVNMSSTQVDFLDPALAYYVQSWQVLSATELKLFNYPDVGGAKGSVLVPEAAAGFPVVSKDGKTYTITVKSGFKFSDGTPVTAANFAAAINRDANPDMQSGVVPFMNTVKGFDDAFNGKAKTVSGVKVKGNKLIIQLTQPDGGLVAKLGMSFFAAIPKNMAIDPKGLGVYPSAGPYHITEYTINRHITLERNKYYKGNRPANVDSIDITMNTNVDQSLLQVKAGQVDYDSGGLPPSAHADLAQQYGINKGRYFVNPLVETDYAAMNTTAGRVFSDVSLRKAVNFAVDRPAMLRQRGAFAGKRTVQILPPGMRGFQRTKVYPIAGSNVAKAKDLAGNKCGKVNLWSTTSPVGTNQSQVMKYDLSQMGCDVNVKLWVGTQGTQAADTKGADFDMILTGWNQDYPDPYDFLDILLNGNSIKDDNNNNLAYFNNASINKQLAAANKLSGDQRYKTYGKLDVNITSNYAPWVSWDNRNTREFIGSRVGGYLFQPAQAAADYNTFYIK
jgi:ABC-type oligopeptide transport system substrate-binding subunit